MDEEERNVLKNYGNFSLWFAFAQNRVSILLIRYQATRAATTILTYIFFLRSHRISRARARTHTNVMHPAPNRITLYTNLIRDLCAHQNLISVPSICSCSLHRVARGVYERVSERCYELRRCICCIVRRMPREINNCVQKFICNSVQCSTRINGKERVSCFVLCVRATECVCVFFFHLFLVFSLIAL